MDIGKKPFYVTKFDWVKEGVSGRQIVREGKKSEMVKLCELK